MSEETLQVHSTGQEAEPTQPDVTDQLDQSTSETDSQSNDAQQPDNQEGKDPTAWARKRIDQLTAQKHETARELESAKNEAARYRMLVEQLQQGGDNADKPKVPGQEPNIDELVERRASEKAQQQAMVERGQSVAKTGAEQFTDFQDAVQTLDALGITSEQVQSLLGMDDAHAVIYNLGKNPEEAARILAMSPLQQGRELERLAAKAAKGPAPKAVSNAPAPVRPLDSASAGEKDPSKMSAAEWMAWREKTSKVRI
jgi:hypothetical protein